MTLLAALARAGLRERRPLIGLALPLALGIGVAMASLEAAERTEHAYPSYLKRSNVSELVVNPSLITDRAEEIIRTTPGVRGFVSDSLLNAGDDSEQPTAKAEADNEATQVRMSTNGRYITQDRPVIREGRMIRSGSEAFVNVEMADDLNLRLGSLLPLAFFPNSYDEPNPSVKVEPLGRAEVKLVGIGIFPDEVLVDGLYPRHRMIITGDVGSKYDCTLHEPDGSDPRGVSEIAASITPPACAMSYRYYSLRLDGGARAAGRVSAALATRFLQQNEQLPPALQAAHIGYELIPTVTSGEAARVRRSLEPAVKSLQLFALAATLATVVLALLGAVRIARRHEHDTLIWRDLGVARSLRTAGVAAPLAIAALFGLAGAVFVGWLASGIGPVASARTLEGTRRLGLSARPVVLVLGVSSVVILAGLVFAAARVTRSQSSAVHASAKPSRALAGVTSPPLALGVRASTVGAGSRALLAASVTVVTAVLATVVFSASLSGLVSHPARFGWPYDVAATINYGYGGSTDMAAIKSTLDRPEVDHWGVAVLATLTIGADSLPFVAERSGFDGMPLPVVKGRLPVTDDEIALGALTAKKLRLDVGETALVKTQFGERKATITGFVVMPPIGSFQSDRASTGTGALLSQQFVDTLIGPAAKEAGTQPADLADTQGGFVAIDLHGGVDRAKFLSTISEQMSKWDSSGTPPFVYPVPVRPATVANVAAMQTVPVLLASLLALTMAAGLVLSVSVAARARRRELALLRALGCVGRQLRATVRWQALTVVGFGLVVGVPFGLALGRVTYSAFVDGLGVRPDPVVSPLWLGALVGGTVATSLLASIDPGRRATKVDIGTALRPE